MAGFDDLFGSYSPQTGNLTSANPSDRSGDDARMRAHDEALAKLRDEDLFQQATEWRDAGYPSGGGPFIPFAGTASAAPQPSMSPDSLATAMSPSARLSDAAFHPEAEGFSPMPIAATRNAPPQGDKPADFLAPDNIPYGQFVERVANQALTEAGVFDTFYDDPDILAAAWGQAMGSLGDLFNTEIGARIYRIGGKWAVAPAKSNGADYSEGIGHVNVGAGLPLIRIPLRIPKTGEYSSIHTHDNNLGFSTQDTNITDFKAEAEHHPWSGYVVNQNHQILGYSAPDKGRWRVK
jgi:hypothetical protein